MRRSLFITYDICDPKRGRDVYRLMRGYGDHLQLSVFYCELSALKQMQMEERLEDIIEPREDQVIIVDLGRVEGRGSKTISALGRPYVPPERSALIV